MRTISHHPLIWLAVLVALVVCATDATALSLPRTAPRAGGSGWGGAFWHALGRFLLHEPGLLWYLLVLAIIIGLGYFGWSVGEQLADRAKPAPPAPPCAPAAPPPAPPVETGPNRDPALCPRCLARHQFDGRACVNCGYVAD